MIIKNGIWKVYIHIFPNNKYYVGITSISLEDRWKNGRGYYGQKVYKAIQKYDWDNIEHIIFATNLTFNEATNIEKILIEKLNSYKNGYNCTLGGEGNLKHSLEDRQKMLFLWHQGYNLTEIGKQTNCNRNNVRVYLKSLNIPEEELNKRGQNHSEYNLDKTILKLWNQGFSNVKIASLVNRNPRAISKALNRLNISKEEKIQKASLIRTKKILQYDKNWNFLNEYNSTKDAAEIIGFKNGANNIRHSCNSKKKLKAYGYYWEYKSKPNGDE